jgi:5'-deoxynucleotidase YfbR-like HD superfamily hydrolase
LNDIEKVLNFIVEIEKLKAVIRKTKPVGMNRYENSAEHSWHVCLSALMLKDYANEDINIDRVIKMLLIHDLGEIDVGDIIVYEAENEDNKNKEAAGLERILKLLPDSEFNEYFSLWQEFELGESLDAMYAKAIDRVPPLLHNLHGNGHSWRENNVPKEKVFSVNSKIKDGSQQLWDLLQIKLEKAVTRGILK